MGKANERSLHALHEKVAQHLLQALDSSEQAKELLQAFEEELPAKVADFLRVVGTTSPALLTVAARFLKDNDITVDIQSSDEMSDLARQLEKKQTRRDNVINVPFAEHYQ